MPYSIYTYILLYTYQNTGIIYLEFQCIEILTRINVPLYVGRRLSKCVVTDMISFKLYIIIYTNYIPCIIR